MFTATGSGMVVAVVGAPGTVEVGAAEAKAARGKSWHVHSSACGAVLTTVCRGRGGGKRPPRQSSPAKTQADLDKEMDEYLAAR